MKRIFIIHRWSGGPDDDWRPWLKTELENKGYKVYIPYMPDTEVPIIEKWVNYISKLVGIPDGNTYFIGHSIGCQAILRYLENIDSPIGGALFVAGWFNLENLEDDEIKKIAKPWIENPLNFNKIKSVLPKSTLIISDDDPYGAFKENTEKFSRIVTNVCVLQNKGHITQKNEPVILDQFFKLIN